MDYEEASLTLYNTSLEILYNLLLHTDARVLQAVAAACAHLVHTSIYHNNTGEI